MALVPGHKNVAQILKRFQDRALQRTDISNFDRDSKFRAIGDVLSEELLRDRQDMIASFEANQFTKASPSILTALGEQTGCAPQRQASFAVVTRAEFNVAWTVIGGGTFGSINGGAPFTLPRGTSVFSNPNSNEFGESVQYATTDAVVCSPGATMTHTPVRAMVSGSRSNVGVGALRNHGFTGYTDVANSTLRVSNFFPILTGQDPETPAQYRSRLANYYATLLQNNEIKARLDRVEVPGVLDIKVIENYYGVGSAAAIVLGAENLATASLVAGVQKRLNAYKTPGLTVTAIAAVEVQFDFEIDLYLVKATTTQEQNRISSNVLRALRDYLGGRQIGGVVDLDEMLVEVQQAGQGMLLLQNRDDREKLFKSVWIRRSASGGIPDERSRLIQTQYSLRDFEYAASGTLTANFVG